MNRNIVLTDRRNCKVNRILYKNRAVERNSPYIVQSCENQVNLNAWIIPEGKFQNVGDYISVEIVKNTCKLFGIDMNQHIDGTKHLYAIGSILMGYQDAVIWGSGFGYDNSEKIYFMLNSLIHKLCHKIDIRAVRGPETRRLLMKIGYSCPEVYGDPAVLLPLFYKKRPTHKISYVIIPHYSKLEKYRGRKDILETFQPNWQTFIDALLEANLVVSSSLHGIILAEAYGIPAVMLNDTPSSDITKYKDWYYSTERYNFIIANSLEEAIRTEPKPLNKNVVNRIQTELLNAFPKDLWD